MDRTNWQSFFYPLLVDVPWHKPQERSQKTTTAESPHSHVRAISAMRSPTPEERKKEHEEKAQRCVYAYTMHVFALAHVQSFGHVSALCDPTHRLTPFLFYVFGIHLFVVFVFVCYSLERAFCG